MSDAIFPTIPEFSYAVEPEAPVLETEFESGHIQSRRQFPYARRKFNLQWHVASEEQFRATSKFLDLHVGDTFQFKSPVSRAYEQTNMVGDPDFSSYGTTWDIGAGNDPGKGDNGIWTEVDPDSAITTAGQTTTFTNLDRLSSGRVYQDLGTNYFFSDFRIDFNASLTSGGDGCDIHLASVTDAESNGSIVSNLIAANFNIQGGNPSIRLIEKVAGVEYFDEFPIMFGTTYYLRLMRVSGAVSLEVYSDPAFSTAVTTLVLSLHSTVQYRYVYKLLTRGDASVVCTGAVSNLFLYGIFLSGTGAVARSVYGDQTVLSVVAAGTGYYESLFIQQLSDTIPVVNGETYRVEGFVSGAEGTTIGISTNAGTLATTVSIPASDDAFPANPATDEFNGKYFSADLIANATVAARLRIAFGEQRLLPAYFAHISVTRVAEVVRVSCVPNSFRWEKISPTVYSMQMQFQERF